MAQTITVRITAQRYDDYRIVNAPDNERCETCEYEVRIYTPGMAYYCCKRMTCYRKAAEGRKK